MANAVLQSEWEVDAKLTPGDQRPSELSHAGPARLTPGELDCDIPAHGCVGTRPKARGGNRPGRHLMRIAAVFAIVLDGQEASDQWREQKRGCDPTSQHD